MVIALDFFFQLLWLASCQDVNKGSWVLVSLVMFIYHQWEFYTMMSKHLEPFIVLTRFSNFHHKTQIRWRQINFLSWHFSSPLTALVTFWKINNLRMHNNQFFSTFKYDGIGWKMIWKLIHARNSCKLNYFFIDHLEQNISVSFKCSLFTRSFVVEFHAEDNTFCPFSLRIVINSRS